MNIIRLFCGDVTHYLKHARDWFMSLPKSCPICGCKARSAGKFLRTLWAQSEFIVIPIYRRHCKSCHKTFSFFPPFLKPYARFANAYRHRLIRLHVVEKVSMRKTPVVAFPDAKERISVQTLRRWLRAFNDAALRLNAPLASRLHDLLPGLRPPKLKLNSESSYLLDAASAFHVIVCSRLPEENLHSLGVFDMLNLSFQEAALV